MPDPTSFAVETPLWASEPLSRALGVPVHLKMEALQPCGSFKIRGLGRVCATQVAGGARRLLCSSGGNAGLAVAYAGQSRWWCRAAPARGRASASPPRGPR